MDQLLTSTNYHISNHANGDEDLFREPENYSYFLLQYHMHIDKIADTYCFWLMPNLFHVLVRIKPKEATTRAYNLLSKQFSNFFKCYT